MKYLPFLLLPALLWAACQNSPQTNLINSDACTVPPVVAAIGDSGALYVPNIFTPNGDVCNDVFQVKGMHIASFDLRIETLNGNQVFATTNIDDAWDGTDSNGDPVRSTLYDYFVTVTDLAGQSYSFNGQVAVVRPSNLGGMGGGLDEGETFEIQNCDDCVFPDQIDPRNGPVYQTGQQLGDLCQ